MLLFVFNCSCINFCGVCSSVVRQAVACSPGVQQRHLKRLEVTLVVWQTGTTSESRSRLRSSGHAYLDGRDASLQQCNTNIQVVRTVGTLLLQQHSAVNAKDELGGRCCWLSNQH